MKAGNQPATPIAEYAAASSGRRTDKESRFFLSVQIATTMDLPFPTPALFTAKGPFEAPEWVPVCVQYKAELLRNGEWEPALTSEDEETIRRLLTDEEMRTVWPEFYKKKRLRVGDESESSETHVNEPIRELKDVVTLSGWTTQDLAAMEYFEEACTLAISHMDKGLISATQRKGMANQLTDGAEAMRKVAKLLHYGYDAEYCRENETAPRYEDALEEIARHLEALAKFHRSKIGTYEAARRDRGDRELRAFVVLLGHLTKSLFGKNLYGTVATTAAVALQREVDAEKVRRMLSGR